MDEIITILTSQWKTIIVVFVMTIPLIITGLHIGNIVDRSYNKNNTP